MPSIKCRYVRTDTPPPLEPATKSTRAPDGQDEDREYMYRRLWSNGSFVAHWRHQGRNADRHRQLRQQIFREHGGRAAAPHPLGRLQAIRVGSVSPPSCHLLTFPPPLPPDSDKPPTGPKSSPDGTPGSPTRSTSPRPRTRSCRPCNARGSCSSTA